MIHGIQIFGTEYSVDEIITKTIRVKPYIDASHGGITISGGEPLLQIDFLIELFKQCKKLKIHTALDTAGSLPITDKIKELLSYTDLVLLDIKHIDNDKCIFLTGVPNANNLKFAKYLSENNIPMWIRQVLIPGYTDDEQDLLKLRKFLDTLNNIQKIELLPYHDLGKHKWENLGLKYELEGIPSPTEEQIQKAKKILEIK